MSIDAMKQALAALEGWANHGEWVWPESALEQAKRNTTESITALRAAIQQAQEPMAWMTFDAAGEEDDIWYDNPDGKLLEGWTYKPLYTSLRQWQGLTDDDIAQAMYRADAIITGPMQFKFAREIEAKLKEKNNE